MKKLPTVLLVVLTGTVLCDASEAPAAPCCVADKPVAAACCAADAPAGTVTATSRPLSSRSLYQFDAVWTDDHGSPVKLATWQGRPVIVAMFFAQCEYACPMLVGDIQRVRAGLPAAVRDQTQVILISFDSERDTPAALRAYRERMALDAQWTLLRGESDTVQEFAMLLGVKFKRDLRGQFAHSNLLTILDSAGEIVHQRAGLQGDVSETTKAVVLAAR